MFTITTKTSTGKRVFLNRRGFAGSPAVYTTRKAAEKALNRFKKASDWEDSGETVARIAVVTNG